MMSYEELLAELYARSDEKYRAFHFSLLNNKNLKLIGVRVPQLRTLAKEFKGAEDVLLSYPDEFFDVKFIKLSAVAALPYDKFILRLDYCVNLLDNWASCDGFKARCIASRRDDFVPYIEKYLASDAEFSQRYALVTLLDFYVDKPYIPYIFDCCVRADCSMYYVHMGAAWLIAEVLVKYFNEGCNFLKRGELPAATHNKAIQKARESFRLTPEQKQILNNLKRK